MMRRKSVQKPKIQIPVFGNEKILFYDFNDVALMVAKILSVFDNKVREYKCGNVEIFDFKDYNSFVINIPYRDRRYVMFVSKDATDEEILDGLAKIAAERSEQLAVLKDAKCNTEDAVLNDRLAFIITSVSMLIA